MCTHTQSAFYGKEIITADREKVEQGADEILERAKETDVAFLVVGDPFGATTHTDLLLRAKKLSIPCQVVHNASILNAVGACGLQLYSFGETVSIPFWTDTWRPISFFDKICENKKRGLHTLCLLGVWNSFLKNFMKSMMDDYDFMNAFYNYRH
jgi:diphthine synthase